MPLSRSLISRTISFPGSILRRPGYKSRCYVMNLWDRGNKGDALKEVSEKRKPSPKLLLEAKCTPPSRGYGENLSRPYCASQVINTAQTIVAKNGERARSRIVLPGQRSAATYTRVCMRIRACVRATGLRSNGDKVVGAKRARLSGASGPRRGSRRRRAR